MSERGRVLRDTSHGIGLISANGKQYEFQLEGMWKSDISPKQNMFVEFDLNEDNKIVSVVAVNESDLAREQAEKVVLVLKDKGSGLLSTLVDSVGKPVLISTAIIGISWIFLSAITINLGFQSNNLKITFWNLLEVLNAGNLMSAMRMGSYNEGAGIYGFFGILALLGPFISHFWKDTKAYLGYCLPLLLMLFVGLNVYFEINDGFKTANSLTSQYGAIYQFTRSIADSLAKAMHIGAGSYLAFFASIYLSLIGMKKYFAAKA